MTGRQAALANTVLDLIFAPGARSDFEADPRAFGAARGLEAPDQAALAAQARRLGVYRGLVKATLLDPLADCFPLCQAALDPEGLWEPLLEAFFASRSVQSLYYRDIPPTFLAWLAETRPHAGHCPWLLALAHYEYMEMELLRCPDTEAPRDLAEAPTPEARVVADGTLRALAYDWRVHHAEEEDPVPQAGASHLLCYRDREGRFSVREVGPARTAFLTRILAGAPLGEAAGAVGLPWEDAAALLADLRGQGGVLGFR